MMTTMRPDFVELPDGMSPNGAMWSLGRERLPDYVCACPFAGAALDRLRVLIVGAGAVGAAAALHLARLSPAELAIVDPKNYKAESVLTQPVGPGAINANKAHFIARRCKEISPRTTVRFHPGRLQDLLLLLLALSGFSAVVLASDNLLTELETGRICNWLGLPLFHASVHGETMIAQVRVFANETAESPCPACLFSPPEWELLSSQVSFSCEGASAGSARPEVSSQPTMSTSSQCGLAASLAVTQVLRFTLGLGAPVGDTMLENCGLTHRSLVNDLRRNPNCRCDHARYRVITAPRPLERCNLVELARNAGLDAPHDFTVGDWWWAERAVCEDGHDQAGGRFVDPSRKNAGRCDRCGKSLLCQPFFLHRRISAHCFETMGHRRLRELGADEVDWVVVRGDRAGALFHNPVSSDE